MDQIILVQYEKVITDNCKRRGQNGWKSCVTWSWLNAMCVPDKMGFFLVVAGFPFWFPTNEGKSMF